MDRSAALSESSEFEHVSRSMPSFALDARRPRR
jgi:hypothetical protein